MMELLSAIAGILLVDLVLSGDNALVIGAAAAGLPQRQRWIAIFFGGAGAAVLRIVFAFIASFLLVLPWLQAIGGLILLIIAIRLLADRDAKRRIGQDPGGSNGFADPPDERTAAVRDTSRDQDCQCRTGQDRCRNDGSR